ncbi:MULTISPECIES: DUF6894 family protein [Methylobacterium]|uniref:DUF6894 domain-containing protein n=1 Tax=Methylobacterium thuringiense TaxID=1003091 RepID=A0ABQ4TJB3_9HYPH|nr:MULTISPECIES: hypothetical protein [Methylobacterium]TXN20299.1 hypothetical protein FV217_18470 [Methylobacterium sp. WL9]GJE55424.1 hypothetical protein EKPJFOCH_1915 [Methylobacterium thuringiense]
MPRYYFDIDDSISIHDEQGQDFSDSAAAQAEAFRRAAVYGGDPANLEKSGVIVVTVRDGPDSVVVRVRLICQVDDRKPGAGANSGVQGSMPHVA